MSSADSSSRRLPRLRHADLAFALCALAGLAFLLWKARFGYASTDETFYLTIPYRLSQGEALLVDEWNLAQLSGFLLYPAMKLYLALAPSAEGIALCFRYIYVAAQLMTAGYVYLRLRRISPEGALAASLLLLLFAPMNIMALSYYSMGVMLLASACVTLATTDGSARDAVLSGLLFAGAVLNMPYLIALYPLYSLFALLPATRRGGGDVFSPGFWLRFTVGAAALALVFAVFLLSRASIEEIMRSLPYILSDPEHKSESFAHKLFKYAEALYANAWANELALGWVLPAIVMAFDKNRLRHRSAYLIPALLFTAAHYSYYILRDRQLNYLMFPINILGGYACFLCRERDIRPFLLVYIPGILFSMCMSFSSNMALQSIGCAMTVSCLASACYIVALAKELWSSGDGPLALRRVLSGSLALALLLQLSVLVYFRQKYVYWDSNSAELTAVIDAGPQKGLKTRPGTCQHYGQILADAERVRRQPGDCTLYYTFELWMCLMDDARLGTFSTWLFFLFPEASVTRLQDYWRLDPERTPDNIYISDGIFDRSLYNALTADGWTAEELLDGALLTPAR